MYFLFITLLIISANVQVHSTVKIVGGSDININQCPYQLSLQKNNKHICGAIVISKSWALTAAGCIQGVTPKDITLRAGSDFHNSGGTLYTVKKVLVHESYNDNTKDNDVALIEVSKTFDSKIAKPVKLVSAGSVAKPGTQCLFTGWGSRTLGSTVLVDKLQQMSIPLVDSNVCRASSSHITTRMICAGYTTGGKDICNGDWGGPLVSGDHLLGIASWSSCGRTGSFGVYTSVSALRNWIKNKSGI